MVFPLSLEMYQSQTDFLSQKVMVSNIEQTSKEYIKKYSQEKKNISK